jgi:hypothetical protein
MSTNLWYLKHVPHLAAERRTTAMARPRSRRRVRYAMLISAVCFQMGLNRAGYGSVSMPSRCGGSWVDLPETENFRCKDRRVTKGVYR